MQGFNMGRYHAPESLDKSLTTSSSSRLKSAKSSAPPTVRFEMPFAVWCSTCPESSTSAIIGQGVRFNAQKKRVGSYLTSPVWSFRMKHTACGGWIEIRTNPAIHDFEVTEGARKRDYGDDAAVAERIGGVVVGDAADEEERKRQDAFAAFEGKASEKVKTKSEVKRLEEIRSRQERDWRDPDAANKRMRASFRLGRQQREKEESVKEAIQDRYGLGIEIVEEQEIDKRRAALQDFGVGEEHDSTNRALFSSTGPKPGLRGKTMTKLDRLRNQLKDNTRASLDPFTVPKTSTNVIPGLKRKRGRGRAEQDGGEANSDAVQLGLVSYDSD